MEKARSVGSVRWGGSKPVSTFCRLNAQEEMDAYFRQKKPRWYWIGGCCLFVESHAFASGRKRRRLLFRFGLDFD